MTSRQISALTADDARAVVYRWASAHWQGRGTPTVGDVRQDDDFYAVEYGNREFLADGDVAYMLMDAPVAMVGKQDGALSFIPHMGNEDRVDAMRPV